MFVLMFFNKQKCIVILSFQIAKLSHYNIFITNRFMNFKLIKSYFLK